MKIRKDRLLTNLKKIIYNSYIIYNFYLWFKCILGQPRLMVLDIGSSCNANCPFCPRGEGGNKLPHGIMSKEVFDTIFVQLRRMRSVKTIRLYAFGEPLLNKNVGYIIKRLKSIDKTLILSTNTTNLNKYIPNLMDLDVIQFSIEGWDKESYELYREGLYFEQTLHNLKLFDETIKRYRAEGRETPQRRIHLLLNKNTKIDEFIKLWGPYTDEINVDIMYLTRVWDYNRRVFKKVDNDNLVNICFSEKKKPKIDACFDLFDGITLNSNGDVVLCCFDFAHGIKLGDYKNLRAAASFFNKWFILKEFANHSPQICGACPVCHDINLDEVLKHFPRLPDLAYNPKIALRRALVGPEKRKIIPVQKIKS